MKKFIFLAGLAVGFVLGSRMGRGPYESLERTAWQVADDPQVQRRAAQARETAGRVAQDAAETAKEKAPEVASNVQDTVAGAATAAKRSEEHTSELQSRGHLVCRLLLEKKKKRKRAVIQETM